MSDGTAAAIAARGVQIPLATGELVRLRYSMLSIELLEQQFGDLTGIVEHVEAAADAMLAKERRRTGTALEGDDAKLAKSTGAIFTEIVAVLLPGLIDEQLTDVRTGTQVWAQDNPDAVKRALDPGHLREYLEAFRTAFSQSFDTGEPGSTPANPPVPVPAAAPAFPGPTGITSPAASDIAPMSSSGA